MTETKKLIEVIEGTIQAYQKGERLPISKQGIEYLKEIKGILEGKQKYSLKGVCEWWIKTYPEDVFKGYEYITDIREHMVKILEKLQVAIPQCEPQPQPDEDEEITEQELDSIDILISAFEREVKYEGRFTIGNNWIRESVIDDLKTIRTLLQSRQPVVTRGEIEQWVTMLIGDYADNKEYFKQCVTMTVNLFKSKGVDVRGEK